MSTFFSRALLPMLAIFCFAITIVHADENSMISASDASKYVGQKKTVCGKIASTKYLSSNSRQPTFLNLDKAYPDQIFTIVIWGSDRKNFPKPPETAYADQKLCVTGTITNYKDKPEIVVNSPGQIQIMTEKK